jgi:fatty acid desaturase
MAIRVNRVLSKKQNIAGIPAEIFLPIIVFDVVAGIVFWIFFSAPFLPVVFICLTINIVWAILVARGTWRYLGTFYHPPRYYRQNIRYTPFLDELMNDDRPHKKTKKRTAPTRKTKRGNRRP